MWATRLVVVEVREVVVTGEGDEVVVAGGLVTLEAAGHVGMILLGSLVWRFFMIEEDARVAHSSSGFWLDEWGARVLEERFA